MLILRNQLGQRIEGGFGVFNIGSPIDSFDGDSADGRDVDRLLLCLACDSQSAVKRQILGDGSGAAEKAEGFRLDHPRGSGRCAGVVRRARFFRRRLDFMREPGAARDFGIQQASIMSLFALEKIFPRVGLGFLWIDFEHKRVHAAPVAPGQIERALQRLGGIGTNKQGRAEILRLSPAARQAARKST